MSVGKKLFIINTIIIIILSAFAIIVTANVGKTVLKDEVKNKLVDTVTRNSAKISEQDGVVPDDFDYIVDKVYLSVFYSDGTLKNGSSPTEISQNLHKGVINEISVNGESYFVYDFEITLVGRNSIYLRGVASTGSKTLNTMLLTVSIVAAIISAFAIIVSLLLIKSATKPLEQMRVAVSEVTHSGDLTKRLNIKCKDKDILALQKEYNFMLESLKGMFDNQERFTSDVSHELRTPLTVILSEAEFAIEEAQNEDDRVSSLKVIQRQTKKLTAITTQILEFSRFANRVKTELVPNNISRLCQEMSDDFIGDKNIVMNAEIDEGIVVNSDETLFVRMLQNLIDNAVKYGKENGHIFLKLKKSDTKAVLTIADDGIGMSEENVKHAFERFYQAEKSRTERAGLGLGLCFVKEIVRLMQGEISVSSKLDVGTEFVITFDCK